MSIREFKIVVKVPLLKFTKRHGPMLVPKNKSLQVNFYRCIEYWMTLYCEFIPSQSFL